MEEIINSLEKIIALIERLSKLQLLTLAIILMSALSVILINQFPFINDKLSDMKTLYMIAVITACITSSIFAVRAIAGILKYSPRRAQRVINNVLREMKTLTPDELALLKYVYDTQRSAVYIPGTGACLSLLKKGYLRLILDMVCKRWTSPKEPPCLCYFCELQTNLRPLIRSHYNAIDWKNTPAPDYDKYQES